MRDERQADYVAHYFASAKASLIEKWIRDGFEMPVGQLVKLYANVALPYWEKIPPSS